MERKAREKSRGIRNSAFDHDEVIVFGEEDDDYSEDYYEEDFEEEYYEGGN